jgi:hypothetical protein
MPQVTFTVRLHMRGSEVADLQDVLSEFLNRRLVLPDDEAARRALAARLASERERQTFGESTAKAVALFQQARGLRASGAVDEATARAINRLLDELDGEGNWESRFIVRGTVRVEDGAPLVGVSVSAIDRDMREAWSQPLGQALVDGQGRYEIRYSRRQFRRAEKEAADLVVRALDVQGAELARSSIVFNASPVETIDLALPLEKARLVPGTSEYERYVRELAPLMASVPLEDLTDDDISFLAGDTDMPSEHLGHLRLDARWSKRHNAERAVFYGLLRQDLPSDYGRLLAEQPTRIEQALKASLAANVVPSSLDADLDHVLERLEALAVDAAFELESEDGSPSLGAVLRTAPELSEAQRREVVRFALRDRGGDGSWERLHGAMGWDEATVAAARFTVGLGALAGHVPLVDRLQHERLQGRIGILRDLARLGLDDWRRHVAVSGFPSSSRGNTDAEKAAHYADAMAERAERAFPTASVAFKLARDGQTGLAYSRQLASSLLTDPDFDLARNSIGAHLAEHPVPDGVDAERFADELKRLQRVFRLAPEPGRYEAMQVLLADGLDSANRIHAFDRTTFVDRYSDALGGEDRARDVKDTADRVAAQTQILFTRYGADHNTISMAVMSDTAAEVGKIAELEELFGSLGFCDCEHCRSVYSPAAYLVDLLEFLGSVAMLSDGEERSARDVLLARRPDIAQIELSCRNTNTLVPYVDLVNEVLEEAIAPTGTVPQTGGAEEDIRVHPEHLNREAYEALADAVHPWSLPFVLAAEEARAELGHLGVPRHALMETFREGGADPHSVDWAAERLGLSTLERQLITGTSGPAAHEAWGLAETGNVIPDPEDPVEWLVLGWIDVLRRVPELLDRSGLEHDQLSALLEARYVNPDGALAIEFPLPDPDFDIVTDTSCDLRRATLSLPAEETEAAAALDRIHRFARLQAKLGWSVGELDAALRALAPAPHHPSDDVVIQVSLADDLADGFGVPLVEMLGWWGNLDTVRHGGAPSLYEQVFLSEAVSRPVDPGFALNAAGTELADTSGSIRDRAPALIAAFEITEAELSVLVEQALDDDALHLANLSALYRSVSLARALDLPLASLLTLRAMAVTDPFSSPRATRAFVEIAQDLAAVPLSIGALAYLLDHRDDPHGALTRGEAEIGGWLAELRRAVRAIAAREPVIEGPAGERLREALGVLLGEDLADHGFALVRGDTTEDEAAQRAFIAEHFAAFLGAGGLTVADAQDALVGEDALVEPAERFRFVAPALFAHLSQLEQSSLVKERLAGALGLEVGAAELLLDELVPSRLDPARPLLSDFLDSRFLASVNHDVSRDAFPAQFDAFLLAQKIASLVKALKVGSADLEWLVREAPDLGWLDLTSLPLREAEADPARFAAWLSMARAAALDARLPGSQPTVYALLRVATRVDAAGSVEARNEGKTAFLEAVATRTGWRLEDLEALLGDSADHADTGRLAVRFPEDYATYDGVAQLVRLEQAFEQLEILGVSAERAWSWSSSHADSTIAADIHAAVRARYDEHRWREVAAALRDGLRERQRAALVAYLVAHGSDGASPHQFRNVAALFEHYLIDAEMSACMMTSRIKQAIGSVQLFVQRGLMNLEPEVRLPTDHAGRWRTWMRSYRVWEANRKAFLYPENWLEPELRDDKSPFFRDLEAALLQNEVTEDSVEDAFGMYLESLDAVGRLEIAGVCQQTDDGADVLHVFGRTRNSPHIYYHRRRVDHSHWTAWERVDADIEGDHLIPVVWNRRLYLFWPLFTEKADEPATIREADSATPPRKHWQIQLAWSQQRNGRWSAKTVGEHVVEPHLALGDLPRPSKSALFFTAQTAGRGLTINCGLARPVAFFRLASWSFGGCDETHTVAYHTELSTAGGRGGVIPLRVPARAQVDKMALLEDVDDGRDDLSLPEAGVSSVLGRTPGTYRITYQHQDPSSWFGKPFFYEDDARTFFVAPEVLELRSRDAPLTYIGTFRMRAYRFEPFYHPFICAFREQRARYGVAGLLDPPDGGVPGLSRQQLTHEYFGPGEPAGVSENLYAPSFVVSNDHPRDEIDFDEGGAYSIYNWELFFHAPLLIADRLSTNQRFEEAQKWLHYIFDPTAGDDPMLEEPDRRSPARFWRVKPFFDGEVVDDEGRPHSIRTLLGLLHYDGSDAELRRLRRDFERQVERWRQRPFNPHLIARSRIVAYQWAVVMKYLDNLIAWGDQLFRRDTIESLNEATQLYVLAAEILGDRPVRLAARTPRVRTYAQLQEAGLDAFDNALVELEGAIAPFTDGDFGLGTGSDGVPLLKTLYFCVPPNDKLLGYWDTVADRLFKIRHCMTIEGRVRELPLFEPPIEPGMLVRAAAAGVDLASALHDFSSPAPHHRFRVIVQKALELCGDVRSTSAALLSALEKQDAEALALLRSEHELKLLGAVRQIKEQQVHEAEESIRGLEKSRSAAATRRDHYLRLLDGEIADPERGEVEAPPEGRLLASETLEEAKLAESHDWEAWAQRSDVLAAGLPLIGDFDVGSSGWAGTPVVKWRWGGLNLAAGAQATSRVLGFLSSLARNESTRASIKSRNLRRAEEWRLQAQSAAKEIAQIDSQIAAAEIRRAIAERDLENHDSQVEHSREVDAFLREKFTNRELHAWTASQLASLHFQSYQAAYDLARRAERAYRRELGIRDSSFIEFGYWDSLKKGLLAGERLHHDLRRMELSYLEEHRRELELAKHVSLNALDPEALLRLRETGSCWFQLPEVIFDLDHPGHYMRRIKSVSLTLPCVTGPYTSVGATLTLHGNRVRMDTETGSGYAWTDSSDSRFAYDAGGIQSIATSSGREDPGMFELNFHDEQYLPFEGAGVVGSWQLELPQEFRQFDYHTIADVVMHVRYTARPGEERFRQAAVDQTQALVNRWLDEVTATRAGLTRLFSLREEFSSERDAFLHPREADTAHEAHVMIDAARFPYFVHDRDLELSSVAASQVVVIVRPRSGSRSALADVPISIDKEGAARTGVLRADEALGGLPVARFPDPADPSRFGGPPTGMWTLSIQRDDIPDAADIEDVLLLIRYEVGDARDDD